MKFLVTMVSLSLMLVACGKNESGGSSSKKSSSLSVLSDQGITIERVNETNNSNQNGYQYGYQNIEEIVIRCIDNNRAGVNTQTRIARLQELVQSTYNSQHINIGGRNYDSNSFRYVLMQSKGYLEYTTQFTGGAYGAYSNNYERCPRPIIGGGPVQLAR